MNLRARIICCSVLALGALTSAAGMVCSIAVPHTGWLPPQPAPVNPLARVRKFLIGENLE